MKNRLISVLTVILLNQAMASHTDSVEIHSHKTPLSSGNLAWKEVNPKGGNPIIFIHGNSASSKVFAKQMNDPTFDERLIFVDLPGHGESDDAQNPDVTYSFKGYAQAILEFMHTENIASAVICGWSLGGHAAIDMAWLEPDRVKGLFLTGTPPIDLTVEGFKAGFKPFEGVEFMSQPTAFTREQAIKFVSMVGIQEKDFPGLIEDNMRTDGKARSMMITNAISGKEKSHREIIETIQTPLAFVLGLNDEGINGDYIKSLNYKNLDKLYELETGHAAFVEAPATFNQFLRIFARKVWKK